MREAASSAFIPATCNLPTRGSATSPVLLTRSFPLSSGVSKTDISIRSPLPIAPAAPLPKPLPPRVLGGTEAEVDIDIGECCCARAHPTAKMSTKIRKKISTIHRYLFMESSLDAMPTEGGMPVPVAAFVSISVSISISVAGDVVAIVVGILGPVVTVVLAVLDGIERKIVDDDADNVARTRRSTSRVRIRDWRRDCPERAMRTTTSATRAQTTASVTASTGGGRQRDRRHQIGRAHV